MRITTRILNRKIIIQEGNRYNSINNNNDFYPDINRPKR